MPRTTTLLEHSPELAAQWHPTKNGNLTPDQITCGSGKKAWWIGSCGHEWESSVAKRTSGGSCPYCSGRKLLPGFNDLASQRPTIAAQWHPTKNENLSPENVAPKSSKKVWWLCPDCGHEWEATINNRANSTGCPECKRRQKTKRMVDLMGSLLERNPGLAAQWHPVKNGMLTPEVVTGRNSRRVWWLCPDCGHEWESTVTSRSNGDGCPECRRKNGHGKRAANKTTRKVEKL